MKEKVSTGNWWNEKKAFEYCLI